MEKVDCDWRRWTETGNFVGWQELEKADCDWRWAVTGIFVVWQELEKVDWEQDTVIKAYYER